MERKHAEKEHLQHGWFKTGTRPSHDDRSRMLRPPPANRAKNDRHINESKDPEKRAQKRPPVRLFNYSTQEQVRNVKKPKDKSGSKPRVPRPINSPRRLGPNGPGDKHNGKARQTHFCTSYAKRIPLFFAAPDVHEVCHEADE